MDIWFNPMFGSKTLLRLNADRFPLGTWTKCSAYTLFHKRWEICV